MATARFYGEQTIKESLAYISLDDTKHGGSQRTLRLAVEEVASNDSKLIRKFDIVTVDPYFYDLPEKVVLVVGPTGSGKTTLINAIANYVLGVEFEDDKRFKLVPKEQKASLTESQTEGIASYTMYHQSQFRIPFTLTLIDTPGYGDTRGLAWDTKNTENIKEFFSSEGKPYAIDSISAILFVVQAGSSRLGAAEKYTYESVLELFGKDMESNMFPVFTFCDDSEPTALNAAKEIGIPCPKFFQINNSIVEEIKNDKPRKQQAQRLRWEDWEEVLKDLMTFLFFTEDQSLILTNAVLQERERLYCKIAGLRSDILQQIVLLTQLEAAKKNLLCHESDLDDAHERCIEIVQQIVRKEDNVSGLHSYICKDCKRNCHLSCKVPLKMLGRLCCIIKNGKCEICGCKVSQHSVTTYHYKNDYEATKSYISEIQAGTNTRNKLNESRKIVEDKTAKYDEIAEKVCSMIGEISYITHRLNEIALRPKAFSKIDYVDLLIKQEEQGQQFGWKARVDQLKGIREIMAFSKTMVETYV